MHTDGGFDSSLFMCPTVYYLLYLLGIIVVT